MNTFPLFFDLQDRLVVIVGGGDVALRKADLLQRSGAALTIVAPHIQDDIRSLLTDSKHRLIEAEYDKQHLIHAVLVIAATDDHALNQRIHADAKALNLPINVVDTPKLCDFIFPAIVDRSPMVIAISSNGKAPVLARLTRAKIESIIPKAYGTLAHMAGQMRDEVKARLPSLTARRRFWEAVFTGEVEKLTVNGQVDNAKTTLQQTLSQHIDIALNKTTDQSTVSHQYRNSDKSNRAVGEVYIVGAGAGDPDLLTFKALRLMQQADIVFYDALVSADIIDLCRRDSDKVFVGKKRSNHAVAQHNINELLVKHAKQGRRVLRLKGGDPFIFGRGGEEIQALIKHDIPYQVVPGITAASAAASHAGIPLTHRDHARSVRFVTGCLKAGTPNEHFDSMLDDEETTVFYMGLHALERLVTGLTQAGKSPTTPIAIISNASLPNQQVLTGTLADIVNKQQQANLPTPALLIMGKVVNLHEQLKWFGRDV